jgi:hypothetical protein
MQIIKLSLLEYRSLTESWKAVSTQTTQKKLSTTRNLKQDASFFSAYRRLGKMTENSI